MPKGATPGKKGTAPAAKRAPRKAARQGPSAPSKGVKLLSGGNPQIPKGDGDAPVQAYLAAVPGWKRDVAVRVDALITRSVPNVKKAVKWNSPLYGIEGQGWFLSVHCYTKFLRIAFFRGTSLKPKPPGESKVEGTRYFDIYEEPPLDEERFSSWVMQAAAIPGWIP